MSNLLAAEKMHYTSCVTATFFYIVSQGQGRNEGGGAYVASTLTPRNVVGAPHARFSGILGSAEQIGSPTSGLAEHLPDLVTV